MLFTQGLAAFILWIVFGLFEWQRSDYLFKKANAIPRTQRTLRATLYLFGSAGVLLCGLYFINENGGFLANGMTYWAWAAVAALGIVFVHGQTLAAVLLLSQSASDVTSKRQITSTPEQEVSNDD